jgi:hypothetical protein
MKALCIIGSQREKGNTAFPLEGVEQPADLDGKDQEIQQAYELGLRVPGHVQRIVGGYVE